MGNDLRDTAILGFDFLESQNAIIDTTRKCLYVGQQQRTAVHFSAGKSNQAPTTPLTPAEINHGFDAKHLHNLNRLLTDFPSVFNNDHTPATTLSARHK